MKSRTILVLVGASIGVLISVFLSWIIPEVRGRLADSRPDARSGVSVVHLLSRPKEFLGQEIVVYGYLADSTGFMKLFLSKQHAEIHDMFSAVCVEDPTPDRSLSSRIPPRGCYVMMHAEWNVSELPAHVAITEVRTIDKIEPSGGIERIWSSEEGKE